MAQATQSEASGSSTGAIEHDSISEPEQPLSLRLVSPKEKKKVKWDSTAVDNEGMGKKSSKCCCIYEKPHTFGESSSEDESDDENRKCRGPKAYHKATSKKNGQTPDCHDCNHCQ